MIATTCLCGRPVITDMPEFKLPCLACQATQQRLAVRRERMFAEDLAVLTRPTVRIEGSIT
jgi:hypothetical protein